MKPLYIWAGGKNKMIPKYLETPGIPTSGFDTYVEPFFGGGAMMIWVKENCPEVKRFVMNDIKEEIVGIYRAIKSDCDSFVQRMDDLSAQYLPLEKAERRTFYYDLREEYTQRWTQWNRTDEAATLYFLMKTAFNGIWQETKTSNGRFATPCGLLNQTTKVYDIDNVREWEQFLQRVDIHCGGWEAASLTVESPAFFFMDPPYRDSFTSYGEGFTDADHAALIDFCCDRDRQGDTVFYCNRDDSDDGFFETHQDQLLAQNYAIKYTAGRRKKTEDGHEAKAAKEILLYSPRQQTKFEELFIEVELDNQKSLQNA